MVGVKLLTYFTCSVLFSLVNGQQVNFYSDWNCQNYIGSWYLSGSQGQCSGGVAGGANSYIAFNIPGDIGIGLYNDGGCGTGNGEYTGWDGVDGPNSGCQAPGFSLWGANWNIDCSTC